MAKEVIFETRRIGTIISITAIDADTGIEAKIQGPRTAPMFELQRLALAKLAYTIKKKQETT